MRWCLQTKLIQNFEKFSELLLSTGNNIIVEFSAKDPTWGAMPINAETLKGKNALGRLLMEIREVHLKNVKELEYIKPLNIPAFLLFDNPIDKVHKPEFVIHDLDDIYAY
ncbi:NADAR family protein [Flavobacterium sp. HJJ]|uniref:NADAR family protein n=1 Tax=Flavobacterium sp. HJJ TaxID=2783792 RepID=UPI001889DEAC|nr:NADAR family protein [Flavobacterium sp. HJJ]MBF4473042.1 NADAR family protein [Flavobacterium sp. HJJ]